MKKVIKDGTVTLTGRGPLTAKEKKELLALSKLPDSEINLSDIPELTGVKVMGRGPLTPEDRKELVALSKLPESELRKLPPGYVVGKFYRPRKTSLTMRLDADVVDWLRRTGEGYQTRVNAYLRELMERNAKA